MANKRECKYCKISDKIHYEADRDIRNNQRIHMRILRHSSVENLYYLKLDIARMTGECIEIKYCPFCRKKAGGD